MVLRESNYTEIGVNTDWLSSRLRRFAFRRSDTAVAPSRGVAEQMKRRYRLPYERIAVIYNPVDLEQIGRLSAESPDQDFRWQGFRVVTCGKLVRQKNTALLIRALALVRSRPPGWSLTVLGDGPEETAMRELATELDVVPGVLSTDCPHSPREILDGGKYGWLVPNEDAEALAGRMWEPDRETHVVFAGRISPEKNIGTLIKAAETICRRQVPVRLTIVGDGKLQESYQRDCEKNNRHFVSFAGYVPNTKLIETRFLGADVFVLPSFEEQGAKVLTEARACSVPLIASRVGGTPALVKDGINGILFDPHSVDELVEKIMLVRENYALRERIVRNGYAFAKNHTLDAGIETIIRLVAQYFDR